MAAESKNRGADPANAQGRENGDGSGTSGIRVINGDALLLVDLQNDFLPGGRIPVRDGRHIVTAVNAYLTRFRAQQCPVFASRCWHPPDHCSFASRGGAWPSHCVAGTGGAAFPADLQIPADVNIVNKAVFRNQDAASAFDDTVLAALLHQAETARLFIAGLTTDHCIFKTASDAIRLNYQVFILTDAIASVNPNADDGAAALAKLRDDGAALIHLGDLVP